MRKPLRVTMYVNEPSDIELRAQETIRIDRLAVTEAGEFDGRRHGDLIRPGVTALRLDSGVYHFRTMTDAALRVVRGGVTAVATNAATKDPQPPPPPPPLLPSPDGTPSSAANWSEHTSFTAGRGDEPPGDTAVLTVTYG
jgi:hypothetical protein